MAPPSGRPGAPVRGAGTSHRSGAEISMHSPIPAGAVRAALRPPSILAALAAAASAQVPVDTTHQFGQIVQVEAGGYVFAASSLGVGTSSGATEFVEDGGGTIDAADDLDLDTYFARNGAVAPEWDVDFGTWTDPHPGSPDFFVFEGGGNDAVLVAPRLPGGTLGQFVTVSGWAPTGHSATGGPNTGQEMFGAAFSVTDLRGPSGAPLAGDAVLEGLRFSSSTVDGAVVAAARSGPEGGPVQKPVIAGSPGAIPAGDGHQTTVVLMAQPYASLGAASSAWTIEWDAPGAIWLDGSNGQGAMVRATFPGDAPVSVEVRVGWGPGGGLVRKDRASIGLDDGSAELHGAARAYQPTELWLRGDPSSMFGIAPNPFLDRRLDVTLTRPDGSELVVPGFFDGDGRGGGSGNVWKARFLPDAPGGWSYRASFREGPGVAVALSPLAGVPGPIDGASGTFDVSPRDPDAPGFLAHGPLRDEQRHYLRFDSGKRFLKGGVNSPENFLAFQDFIDVQDQGGLGILHAYPAHLDDWRDDSPEMPLVEPLGARAIFGALDYLAEQGVNSIYFLPMNLGGDGQDTTPNVGYAPTGFDKTHYHIPRLYQWDAVFAHAQRRGILLQIVLAETEFGNETWYDGGAFGTERKLFFRELVARFGHHAAIKWNLSEENDFPIPQVSEMAAWIRDLDPLGHPVAIHNQPNDLSDYLALLGDPEIGATAMQHPIDAAGLLVEQWRTASAQAGRRWVIDLDEHAPASQGLAPDNTELLRRSVLWDTYLSGGNLEWFLGSYPLPLGGDQTVEDFGTREEMWGYMRHARAFVEALPFWAMEPADGRLTGESAAYGGGEVFALGNETLAVYLPDAQPTGQIDLGGSPAPWDVRWYDPRTGAFEGPAHVLWGPGPAALGPPPHSPGQDWAVLLERRGMWTDVDTISASQGGTQTMSLDGGLWSAGLPYLVLGSTTPVDPPLLLWTGLPLPLGIDGYTLFALMYTNVPPFGGTQGLLDANGRATATFSLAPGSAPSLVGLTLHHLWLADPAVPIYASNVVSLTITP